MYRFASVAQLDRAASSYDVGVQVRVLPGAPMSLRWIEPTTKNPCATEQPKEVTGTWR